MIFYLHSINSNSVHVLYDFAAFRDSKSLIHLQMDGRFRSWSQLEVRFRKLSGKNFQFCPVHFAGGQQLGWQHFALPFCSVRFVSLFVGCFDFGIIRLRFGLVRSAVAVLQFRFGRPCFIDQLQFRILFLEFPDLTANLLQFLLVFLVLLEIERRQSRISLRILFDQVLQVDVLNGLII